MTTNTSSPTRHTHKRNPIAERARDAIVERILWCVSNGILHMPAAPKSQGKAARTMVAHARPGAHAHKVQTTSLVSSVKSS